MPAGDPPGAASYDALWVTAGRVLPVSRPTGAAAVAVEPDADPATAYRLVAAAVREAVAGLDPIAAGIRDAADAFRWQAPAEANRRFLAVIEGLRLLSSIADMAAAATGIDLAELCGVAGAPGPLADLGRALDQLTAQQFAEDWMAVAVTLDDELVPALAGWRDVLTAILLQADFRFRARRAH